MAARGPVLLSVPLTIGVLGNNPILRDTDRCKTRDCHTLPYPGFLSTSLSINQKGRMNSGVNFTLPAPAGIRNQTRGFVARRAEHCSTEAHIILSSNIDIFMRERHGGSRKITSVLLVTELLYSNMYNGKKWRTMAAGQVGQRYANFLSKKHETVWRRRPGH